MDTSKHLTKKERREKRRQEQRVLQEIRRKKTSGRQVRKWLSALLAAGLIGYGLFLLISKTTGGRPGESFTIQGRTHIPVGSEHQQYNSNPPTSGPHYAEPADWGVYQEELTDENAVHSLEHGGIWISYRPDIDDETKEKLEALGRLYSGSVVVSPRSANDSLIAVASWGRLQKLSSFDEAGITEFIKRNKNKSPEKLAL